MIYPATFIVLLFIAVILMITLDMIDHTVAALIGAAIFLIFLSQIWITWQPAMIQYYSDLAVYYQNQGLHELATEYFEVVTIYEAAGPVFNLNAFSQLFIKWVDLGTIVVILSLMVITEIARDSGLFQFIAVNALKLSGGKPRRLLAIFCILTFFMSAVLATTALLMAPLTIVTCDALGQDPAPYLISTAMCGNAGGITTAIASVPAMLVAGATGYDFIWFAINLLPLGLLLLGFTIIINTQFFRRDFIKPRSDRVRELMEINAWTMVEDRGVFYRTSFLFVAMVIGFVVTGALGLNWIVALVFALIFVVFSGVPPARLFREVDWTALFFFIGLFIVVGGMEEFGVLHQIGTGLQGIMGGNPILGSVSLLWISGATSGIIDNIPVTATLIPVTDIVIRGLPGPIAVQSAGTFWGALVAGAVLGGALTPIASVANVLTMTIARREGQPISYYKFLRTGITLFFVYLGVATLYIIARLLFLPM